MTLGMRHVRIGARRLTNTANPDNEIRLDTDLLDERRAKAEELPMSLAWYRRTRLMGGGPPFVRVGNRIFYRRADLRRWIAEREAH
jgi:hypothetical protein